MGDLREPVAVERRPVPRILSLSPTANPDSFSIGQERWTAAEKVSQGILHKVQPTAVSEERRRAVIDYVQRLVRGSLGCEVFPYGSVPLRTYLPDGDIDLTAFGGPMMEDALANDLVSLLEEEGKNKSAEFIVKDVQLIRAEVKLVKCIIQNIVVDISFNQIGGLCTLCFLEQVDHLIGKDHLFKRSIILIKAWCYYESRILGAYHGLISTYALETLVLYIFHLFHSTLDGPLAVLYRFLEYFSKFEWEKYCISLSGPVLISSLPEIVAEAPENDGSDLLLSSDFLVYCAVKFSVPSRGVDTNSRTFALKHLNIVDPLKENNNLGRSVSKGNFFRIRSAFAYGARKLGRILLQSDYKNIVDELCKFFSNTLDRHGSGKRPDVRDFTPPQSASNVVCHTYAALDINSSQVEKINYRLKSCDLTSTSRDRDQECTIDAYKSKHASVTDWCIAGDVLDHRLLGDAMELASSIHEDLNYSNHLHTSCPIYPPHVHLNRSTSNGDVKWGNSDGKHKGYFSGLSLKQSSNDGKGLEKNLSINNHDFFIPSVIKDAPLATKTPGSSNGSHHMEQDWPKTINGASMQSLHSLLDLSGDFNYYFNCLQYGRWCHEYTSNILTFPAPTSPSSSLYVTYSWDPVQQPIQVKRNGFLHGSVNSIIPSQAFYTVNPLSVPSLAFGLEEIPKPRGTGTYFPSMSQSPKGYRSSSSWKGRSQPTTRSPRNTNGRNAQPFTETSTHERSSHEQPPQPESPHAASDQSVINQSASPRGRGAHPSVNKIDLVSHSEGATTGFGSVEDIPARAFSLEQSRQRRHSHTPPLQHPTPSSPTLRSNLSKPTSSRDHGGNSV
ncbi:unnamed protein product [Cuscuta epithymum]|uniref:Polymerase nucleotidyl transferase domain-containing protein n=1 Tax=Cuscuta epithymum TaxID=186058 RepID=A0AAV0D354_9ASTE|nr:unnamed protein product [Cuscuta epithymum]